MGVTIDLYKNLSEPYVYNKNIKYLSTLSGTFRRETTLVNPTIDVESNLNMELYSDIVTFDNELVIADNSDLAITSENKVIDCNYIYIREFNRYYYVNDIVFTLNKLYSFVCHCDLLMSNREKLSELKALIMRNEFKSNSNIEDDKMTYEFYQNVEEYNITDKSEIDFDANTIGDDGCFAISYINDDTSHVVKTIYHPNNLTCLPNYDTNEIGQDIFSKYGFIHGKDLLQVASELYDNDDQLSFITSLIALPFEVPHPKDSYNIVELKLGSTIYSDRKVYGLFGKNCIASPYYKVASFRFIDYYTGTYMDYEPYAKYELYLPFYDYVELKSADIRNSTIDIYYSFDFANGTGRINIVNKNSNYIIKSVEFNFGVKIAVNRNNMQQLNDERTQLAIKGALMGTGAVTSIVGGLITANPLLIAGGVTGLAGGVVDIGSKLALQHEKATGYSNGGINGCYSGRKVKLKITRYVKREPDDYAHYYGRPLNQELKLSELKGYTLIKDIHLNDLDLTKNEIDELYNILTSGIII